MKERLIIIAFFVYQINFAQNNYKLGSFEINNDAVYNTSINSGNVAGINMGFDGANGFVKFTAPARILSCASKLISVCYTKFIKRKIVYSSAIDYSGQKGLDDVVIFRMFEV